MHLGKLITLAAAPLLALALTACTGKKAPPPEKPIPAASGAPIETSAIDYIAEWQADRTAAAKKYLGRQIRLTGRLHHIVNGPELKTKTSIVLEGREPENLEFAQAIVPNDRLTEIQQIKTGSQITLTCTVIKSPALPTCTNTTIER